jgi:hypothetical protein
MFLIFKLLLYVTLAQKRQIEKEDAERWKRIERDREKSGFYLFHSKKRKDKPTFRTMVNFDKALNDPTHVIHRRIEKKNERRAISAPPTINSAVDIETETDRAFNYVLDLGPLHSNPLVISSVRNDDTTKESNSLHSSGNTIVIRDPKDIPIISDSTYIPTISDSTGVPIISDSTGVPIISNSTGIPIISDSTDIPIISDSTDIPIISDSTGVPIISNSTGIPIIGDSTGIPIIGDSTDIPIISDSTGVPIISNSTGIPIIGDSTGIAIISNSTDIPIISDSTGIPTISDSTGIAIISDSMGVPVISCKSNKSDLLSSCSNSAVISVANKQTNESMSLGSTSSRIVTSDHMNSDDIKSNESMLSGSITNMGASNYSSFVINNTDNTKIIELYERLWNCEFSFRRFQIGTHPMHRQPGSGTNTSSRCGTM